MEHNGEKTFHDCAYKNIADPYPWFLNYLREIDYLGYAWLLFSTIGRGGPGLVEAVNPGFPNGKTEIFDRIGTQFRCFLPRYFHYRMDSVNGDHTLAVTRLMEKHHIGFPVVAKPEMGLQGAMVQSLADAKALTGYIRDFARHQQRREIHFQELLEEPVELGAFYLREPGSKTGRVVSLVQRQIPYVKGDGIAPLGDLIDRSRRPVKFRKALHRHHLRELSRVPAKGEIVELGFARNQGGGVRNDVTPMLTEAFSSQIDAISCAMGDFHFGRYDLRCDNLRDALVNNRFKIMEINGALAWDLRSGSDNMKFFEVVGYRVATMKHLLRIGLKNARQGVAFPSTWEYLRTLQRIHRATKDRKANRSRIHIPTLIL